MLGTIRVIMLLMEIIESAYGESSGSYHDVNMLSVSTLVAVSIPSRVVSHAFHHRKLTQLSPYRALKHYGDPSLDSE